MDYHKVSIKFCAAIAIMLLLSACAGTPKIETLSAAVPLEKVSAEEYVKTKGSKGVVLLAVNWNRIYGCEGFMAQLQSIAFERMPLREQAEDTRSDLLLDDAPRLLTTPGFNGYAFLVEPGDYALTGWEIKLWESATKVARIRGTRSHLIKDGKPIGGVFDLRAGEIVYIGHFWLHLSPDCQIAVPLRQYLNGRAPFEKFLSGVKNKYPMLEAEKAQFRLLRTQLFGIDFQLPDEQPNRTVDPDARKDGARTSP